MLPRHAAKGVGPARFLRPKVANGALNPPQGFDWENSKGFHGHEVKSVTFHPQVKSVRNNQMSNSNADLDRFRSDSFEPFSFRDRGAAVPFTTPLLLNARIRGASSGRGPEIVIINPSGGRGVLVLPWSAVPEICSPTLFDRHLWESLAKADDISPIGIRHQAQKLAVQGLAGRQAAIVAKDAQKREEASQRLMYSMLLESLTAATMPVGKQGEQNASGSDMSPTRQAERAVAQAAVIAGLPLARFAADLDALALALSGTTPEGSGADARLRKMLRSLIKMTEGIALWTEGGNSEGATAQAAKFIQETARQTSICAQLALAATDTLIAELGRLVPLWKTEKDKVLERARAPDWVMDGWRTPMALWETASPEERQAIIWEMTQIAPILPREARVWMGDVTDWRETPRRITQVVRDKADWRNGGVLEMVARNESLIGSAISYENQILPMRLPRGHSKYAHIAHGRTGRGPSRRQDRLADIAAKKAERAPGSSGKTGPIGRFEAFRGLGESLSSLNDVKLRKIVALVDQLAHPEIREMMLGPSLPRLKHLRPPRPASFKRLLFLPLAGALTDRQLWRRDEGRIPRSAIAPLIEALSPILEPEATRLSQRMRGAKLEDPSLVDQAGRPLWQMAADAAKRVKPGPSWPNAGLNDQDFEAIMTIAGGIWRHAGPLWEAMQRIGGECPPEILRAAMLGPANEGRHVFAAALETLLLRTSQPTVFVSLLEQKPLPNSSVIEEILNKWIEMTLTDLAEADFETGAQLAEGARSVLAALENVPRSISRLEAKTLAAHRRSLDQFCRLTYREIVTVHVIQALLETPAEETETLSEIEDMARIARSLEDTGRRVGTPLTYQALQQEFRAQMAKLQQEDSKSGFSAMEIARIGEILIGQEAAEAFIFQSRRRRMSLR